MPETVYAVDPTKPTLRAIEPVTFAEIGIKERKNLEKWVCANPELLGDPHRASSTAQD